MAKLSIFHPLYHLFYLLISLLRLLVSLVLPHPTLSNPDRRNPTPSNPVVIPNDVIKEILKLLPVKSLMRFKSVSKDWLSIITDPSFTGDYLTGLKGPIMYRPRGTQDTYRKIYYLNIDDTAPTPTCEVYHYSAVDHGDERLNHSAVVNGLICFYDDGGHKSWLYNIATRERIRLPDSSSPLPSNNEAQRYFCSCRLGFDPVNKLYKLLRASSIYDEEKGEGTYKLHLVSVYWEILTIGVDSSWRTLDSPTTPKAFTYIGLCLDGVMYGLELIGTRNSFLTAFHVAEERFLTIPLPPDYHFELLDMLKMLMFSPGRPCPVLSCRNDLYSYSYGVEGRSEDVEGMWTTTPIININIRRQHLSPQGILPSGKMLLSGYQSYDPRALALYNPINKQLERLAIINGNGQGTIVAPGFCDFFYLEENIVSLKNLTSCPN